MPDTDRPAVIVDQAKLRARLADIVTEGVDFQDTAEFIAKLDEVAAELADDNTQDAWLLGPQAKSIGLWPIHSEGTCDGAILTVDLNNGVRLATLHQSHRDLNSDDATGVYAVLAGLTAAAAEMNDITTAYLSTVSLLPAKPVYPDPYDEAIAAGKTLLDLSAIERRLTEAGLHTYSDDWGGGGEYLVIAFPDGPVYLGAGFRSRRKTWADRDGLELFFYEQADGQEPEQVTVWQCPADADENAVLGVVLAAAVKMPDPIVNAA